MQQNMWTRCKYIEQLSSQVHGIGACMRPVTPDAATLYSTAAEQNPEGGFKSFRHQIPVTCMSASDMLSVLAAEKGQHNDALTNLNGKA